MGSQAERERRKALTGLVSAIGLALIVLGGAEVVSAGECLGEGAMVDVQLSEVRPAGKLPMVHMLQRGNGWNYSDDYVTLRFTVQHIGEYTEAGSGMTRQVNKTSWAMVYFEPGGNGPFQTVVTSVFQSQPRPGWDIEATIVPGTASCRVGVDPRIDRNKGNVVVRPGG